MRAVIARFILLQDNYIFDIFDAQASAIFAERGDSLVVVERLMAPGFDRDEVARGGVDYISSLQPDIVFIEQMWSPEIATWIADACRVPVGVIGSRLALGIPGVDFVLREPDPLSMHNVASIITSGQTFEDACEVAGLSYKVGCDLTRDVVTSSSRLHSVFGCFENVEPDYSCFVRLGPGRPTEIRKHIAADWGCRYRNTPLRAGFYGVQSSLLCNAGGCTFCTRVDADNTPVEKKLLICEKQLEVVLKSFPGVKKVILIDEWGLSYIDELAKSLTKFPLEERSLLVSGRLDHIKCYQKRLLDALDLLSPKSRLGLYQFGIENLSQSVLDRYNKGLTLAQIEEGLSLIDELCARTKKLYVEQSFGFIMFDPWTTLDELWENVVHGRRIGLDRFRGQAGLTKLRLYPENVLYWKALEEGLLLDGFAQDLFGYQRGAAWRFKVPEVQSVYQKVQGYISRGLPSMDALERALRQVR